MNLNINEVKSIDQLLVEIQEVQDNEARGWRIQGWAIQGIMNQMLADGNSKQQCYDFLEERTTLSAQMVRYLPKAVDTFSNLSDREMSCIGKTTLCSLVQKRCPASVRTWAKNMAKAGRNVTGRAVRTEIHKRIGGVSPDERLRFRTENLIIDVRMTVEMSDEDVLIELNHAITELGVEMYRKAA